MNEVNCLKTIIFTFAILSCVPVAALPGYCNSKSIKSAGIINLPGSGYWMQFSSDQYISYTSEGGVDGEIYNYRTKKKMPVNDADPFPVPEGDVLVVPNPLRFYSMDGGSEGDLLYKDDKMLADYQSLGEVEKSSDQRRIRVLNGFDQQIRDFKISKNGDKLAVAPLGDSWVKICPNFADTKKGILIGLQTPMLSKNGAMLANRSSDQTTDIYSIEMPSGNCQLISTINAETDKVAFSYDNKKVLFVVQDPKTGKGRLVEMNIKTGVNKVLTGPNEDVIHQAYKPDGTILYSRRIEGTEVDSGTEVVFMNSDSIPDKGSKESKLATAIGKAWASKCQFDVDDDTANVVGSRLPGSQCTTLVRSVSQADKTKFFGVTDISELIGQCAFTGGNTTSAEGIR